MSETVAQLEALRCAVAAPEHWAGSLGDHIDRGHPDDAQAAQAMADMQRHQAEAAVALAVLSAALARARREAPERVTQWVDWHRERCRRIVAEGVPETPPSGSISDQAVRVFVAREALAEWHKVLAGEQDYVRLNDYFMPDYVTEAEALAQGGSL